MLGHYLGHVYHNNEVFEMQHLDTSLTNGMPYVWRLLGMRTASSNLHRERFSGLLTVACSFSRAQVQSLDGLNYIPCKQFMKFLFDFTFGFAT